MTFTPWSSSPTMELDPRFCIDELKAKFHEADVTEWTAWIRSCSVRIASKEEQNVKPNQIISAPFRHLRTNLDKTAATLEAKPRLVIRGDLDTQLGSLRTDSPMVSWMAGCVQCHCRSCVRHAVWNLRRCFSALISSFGTGDISSCPSGRSPRSLWWARRSPAPAASDLEWSILSH